MPLRAFAVFATLLLSSAAQAPAIDPAGVPGTRILGGGGKLPDAVYERFLALAGGAEKARIVLIPTASGSMDDEAERTKLLQRWRDGHPGFTFELLHTRDRAVADGEAFTAPLRAATGVWLGGGVQKNLADAYLGTRVERELQALLARGGVIGGTSAGTAIQTRTMIQEGKDPPVVAQGFDFVPFAVSDQHFLKRERLPRLVQVLGAHPGQFGIGVDEGTAVAISGRTMQVLGDSKALLVLLAAGERADLVAWQRAAAERAAAAWPSTPMPAPVVAHGALVIVGGGRIPDAVAARFLELAGGSKAKIVLVPSASPAEGRVTKRGTQLSYEVPKEALETMKKKEGTSIDRMMEDSIKVITERIDPNGVLDPLITRSGETGILIELPWFENPAELDAVLARIGNLGKLEFRMVADDDFVKDDVKFNMATEKAMLQAWLKNPANAQRIRDDYRNIRRYHEDGGSPARGNLAWYPHLIRPDTSGKHGDKDPKFWGRRYSDSPTFSASMVSAYDDKEWNNGIVPDDILKLPAAKQYLVEFLALNIKEIHFEGKDLDPASVREGTGPDGSIGVTYAFDAGHAGAYADWSERYKGKPSAIVLDGVVRSAPTFQGRITGKGIIVGDFTKGEVDEIVNVLKASPRIEPVLRSKESIGPLRRDDPFAAMLKRLGASDVRELDCSHPREVTKEKLAVLADATAVWFGGGRQWRLVDAFDGTTAIAAFHAVLARGGVIGGTSAGATIQGEFLVRGNPLGNTEMWCEGYDRGFGFLPGVAIDQHFLARKREADLAGLIAKVPMVIGLGIDEGTAAIVRGSVLEVLGDSKVAVFDARRDKLHLAPEWLAPGERWDLAAAKRP